MVITLIIGFNPHLIQEVQKLSTPNLMRFRIRLLVIILSYIFLALEVSLIGGGAL